MPALVAPLLLLGGVWSYWALNDGGYFGTAFYPGAFVLIGLLFVLSLAGPFAARLRGPAGLSLAAITGLGVWTLLTIAWSSAPDSAVEDGQKALVYACAFGLGIWVCNMLGRRMMWSLTPAAIAGGVAGLVAALALAGGSGLEAHFHEDATLRYPIGYRNANACFFLICVWPMLTLAAETARAWAVKSLLVSGATLCLGLVVLSQSRGSLPAAALALLVFVLVSRRGLRAGIYLVLALVPLLPVLPTLLDVFQHGGVDPGLEPIVQDAGRALIGAVVLTFVISALFFTMIETRLHLGRARVQRISVVVGIGAAVLFLGLTAYFVDRHGGPVGFLDQKVEEFQVGGSPDLTAAGARFGDNVGSNRDDFWRVAAQQGADNPIVGGGSGSFRFTYLEDRHSGESPDDPHSVELLMFGELGLVGLALFALFVGGAVVGALRSRILGPSAIALTATALASGTQLLVQSSYDWFWHYPAVTAPVIYMLGAAVAPRLLDPSASMGAMPRRGLTLAVVVLALACAPIYISDKQLETGIADARVAPQAAIDDVSSAARLNPFASQPLLVEGILEERLGRHEASVDAFRDAVERQPDNYAGHYFLAEALAETNPGEARAQLAIALRQNPKGPEVRRLARRLGSESAGPP